MADDARALIELATRRFIEEVPALAPIKLVVGVELRGRGDVQLFRLQMPDVLVTKDSAVDAQVRVDMRREFFNVMAREGKVPDWIEAFTYGQAKASGPGAVPEADRERGRQAAGTPAPSPRAQAGLAARARDRLRRAAPRRSVVGGQLLREEHQRRQQEQAHHDQREVLVHAQRLQVTG